MKATYIVFFIATSLLNVLTNSLIFMFHYYEKSKNKKLV